MSETTRSTRQMVEYYGQLLIIQYHGKPKAVATVETAASAFLQAGTSVQTLSASAQPASGNFQIDWDGESAGSFAWNASAGAIQTALRLVEGLEDIEVQGSFANGDSGLAITVTFFGVPPPAPLLGISNVTLQTVSSAPVTVAAAEIDKILILAVQDAFNLYEGPLGGVAAGVQLDVLGKYVSATRAGPGFSGQIVLDDSDFLSYIILSIAKNSLGSSLYEIDTFIENYFPGQIVLTDFTTMKMSYLIADSVGSYDLIQRVVIDKKLPKPMGVGITVIYGPTTESYFGFGTYDNPVNELATPFNEYADYNTSWVWLSYAYWVPTV